MKEPDLLTQLGRELSARDAEEAPLDPRLERLALGELTTNEVAALERDGAVDADLAAQIELFRPIAAPGRIADAAVSAFLPATTAAPRPRKSPVRWLGLAAPTLAAAAAVVLLLRVHAPADLPSYRARLTTADVTERGASAPPAAANPVAAPVQSGPDLEIVLRPEHAPRAPLAARAFVGKAGALEPFQGDVEVSTDGAVRLRGVTSEVFGLAPAGGARDVIIAIGAPDDVPTNARAMQRILTDGPDASRLRVVTQHLLLAPSSPP